MAKVLVLYYSSFGHVAALAKAAADGASTTGAQVDIMRVPEIVPPAIVEQQKFRVDTSHPEATPEDLVNYDAILVGTPTNYGNISTQISAFWARTIPIWKEEKLIGKLGGAMSSSSSQHGGNEAALLSMHKIFFHHGMTVVGLPYSFQGQLDVNGVIGGSPYGATTVAGSKMERVPDPIDLEGARYQGAHIAKIAAKLFG